MERRDDVRAAYRPALGLTAGVAPPRRPKRERGDPAGLAARRVALEILADALSGTRALDAALDLEHGHPGLATLADRDRGFVKAAVTETIRRLGQIRDALGRFLERGMPRNAGRLDAILALSAGQILFLDTPAHAVVDAAVRLAAEDRHARHYKGLVNAVLRRLGAAREEILAAQDAASLNTPDWLKRRWEAAFGADRAQAIAAQHLVQPPLDISVKQEPRAWAERLGGTALATGGVRLDRAGDVTRLAGFSEGAWWVQDAAASLPARLLGDVRGMNVADLCAAPGGKTAQIVAAGARTIAVDRSASRLDRLSSNLARLGLSARTITADASTWDPGEQFDAVLLDAPCTATGTLRRHPDIAWSRREADVQKLAELQARLITNAVRLTRPGGLLVYATCSLEPEEGENQIAPLLESGTVERVPVAPDEIGGLAELVTGEGDLRTLPCSSPGAEGGMDGFFAARLRRIS